MFPSTDHVKQILILLVSPEMMPREIIWFLKKCGTCVKFLTTWRVVMVLVLFFILIYLIMYYYGYYFVLVFWTGANNSSLIFSSQSWESVPLDWSTHSRYLPFQELSHVLGPPTSNLVASSSSAAAAGCGLELVSQFFLFLLSELCNLILLKTPWID